MTFDPHAFLAAVQAQYHRKSQESLRALDTLFLQLAKKDRLQLKDGLYYAKLVLLWCFTRLEVHIATVVILLLVLGTGMFVPLGSTDIATRLSVASASLILGTLISFVAMFLLLPLHIRWQASLWAIGLAHALLGALILCSIEPLFISRFQREIVPTFSDIFVPVLLLYMLSNAFVLWQTQKQICFLTYLRQHKNDNLDALLPAKVRGAVFLMSAADHYVEFFSDQGNHMRRMTLTAAVEKTNHGEGMRVHRSHWVAYSAMLALEKDGERRSLTLRNGQRVPVSPKYAAKVIGVLDADCQNAAE